MGARQDRMLQHTCPYWTEAEGRGWRGREQDMGPIPLPLRYSGTTSNNPGTTAQRQCPSWVHLGFEGNWAAVVPESGINPSDFKEVPQHGWNKETTAGVASQPP